MIPQMTKIPQKTKFLFVLFLALFVSHGTLANASQIEVSGRAYSATRCGYFSTSLSDFDISYENKDLPWGTNVTLIYGFRDSFSKKAWQFQGEIQIPATYHYTWGTSLHDVVVDSRGYFSLSDIQFVFKIRLPDGKIVWDNGGKSSLGFYQAEIPMRTCSPGFLERLNTISI